MTRLRSIVLLLVLAALVGRMAYLSGDPVPLAAEDEAGTVFLWPGAATPPAAEAPAAPELLVAPCPRGPQNIPNLPAEHGA